MTKVSVNVGSLKKALSTFESNDNDLKAEIQKIKESLATIEENWSGPAHDSAKTDRTTAEGYLDKAELNLENIKFASENLSENAGKIYYS